ncbi:MAG: 50S ribosomal protein L22 [Patescibacteria group bacterium]
MTLVRSQLKYLRIAPRKVRLVADLIRNKNAVEASKILKFTPKRAAKDLAKLLDSARANARNNFNLGDGGLFIKEIRVDEGSVYKRYMPQARGSAHMIKKRTSHITLVLSEAQSQGKSGIRNTKP